MSRWVKVMERMPVRYGNGFSFGGSPFNWATAAVTKSFKVHCFEIYGFEDGRDEYFEMGLTHYSGPRMVMDVVRWSKARPWRRLWMVWLPHVTPDGAAEKYLIALETYKKKKPYDHWQLLRIWAHEWWGLPVPTDPTKATCSEETALRNMPEYDCRDDIHETFDSVTPASLWRVLATRQF